MIEEVDYKSAEGCMQATIIFSTRTAWDELWTVVLPLLSVRSTGPNGEPLAKIARPSVHSYAWRCRNFVGINRVCAQPTLHARNLIHVDNITCSAVHSERCVGLDMAKMLWQVAMGVVLEKCDASDCIQARQQ